MRPFRPRLAILWLTIAIAALVLLWWAASMVRRSRHYQAQASFQASLEARHRRELSRLEAEQGMSDAPGLDGDADDRASEEAEEAESHARLRRQYERLASHPWEAPPADLPMPYPWDRNRDRQVIEAVLDDLMDPHNPQNAIIESATGVIGSQIVLGETIDSYHRPSEPTEDDGTDNQLWSDLWRRNSAGEFPLSELGVNGKRAIRLADFVRLYKTALDREIDYHDYLQQLYPDACGFVSVTLPGYARDGRRAIISVRSGWQVYHAAYWTYILRRAPTIWVVEKRDFETTE